MAGEERGGCIQQFSCSLCHLEPLTLRPQGREVNPNHKSPFDLRGKKLSTYRVNQAQVSEERFLPDTAHLKRGKVQAAKAENGET